VGKRFEHLFVRGAQTVALNTKGEAQTGKNFQLETGRQDLRADSRR